MHCLWSFSEVVLILKLATDQLAFSVSGKICFMSGFNQTGCSKLEIFLTEVTFICVLISDWTYLIMGSITVSAKFSSISIIYIYIGSSNVSFGFLQFSRQLPSKTEVSIYLSVFVFLFIKERNLTRLKRPYLSSVLCLSRVRERSLVYGDFPTW